MPGYENRPKRAPPRRPILATRPPHAQAHGRPPGSSKCGKISAARRPTASVGTIAGRSGSRFPRPAPPAPLSGDHDLEFDDFAGVTPFRCHLPILAAADRMLAPGIGDCSDGGRNTIYSDSGEADGHGRARRQSDARHSASVAAKQPVHAFRSSGFRPGHSDRFTMKHEQDKDKDRTVTPAKKNTRQDRLKQALRDNLKRRKSQARARGDVTMAPSSRDDVTPHDGSAKKPGE
jgi:hypothetical protein